MCATEQDLLLLAFLLSSHDFVEEESMSTLSLFESKLEVSTVITSSLQANGNIFWKFFQEAIE